MKKVALHTLGCKVNYSETSTIARQFSARGFTVVEQDQPCDVYVLNTCSVTEKADRECRQVIRRVLRQSPEAFIVVVGCYAQLQPRKIAALDGVDLVLGAREKFNLFTHEREFLKKSVPQVYVSCIDEPMSFEPSFSGENDSRTRAFLKVQDGCDYSCSFCTIPMARGRSRSAPVDAIIDQALALAEQGFREVVLTGVNVGDYGKEFGVRLLDLLRKLDANTPFDRIRVSSIEPNLLSEEVVDFILGSERCCNHFHIPLQSGSDAVLKNMRRRYRSTDYRHVIERINHLDPDAGIGADVIVGFPGESDAQFQETCAFLADLPVSYLHVFTYSEREGTAASDFPGSVSTRVRFERSETLRSLGQLKREQFHSRHVGRTLRVLFESADEDGISGLTSNYIRVETSSRDFIPREIKNVKIISSNGVSCRGEQPPHEKILSPVLSNNYGYADA